MATKSTPDGVDLKLSNYSTTAAMNGSIALANNATLATVAANYGSNTVVDQHSLDTAARITPLEVDTKVANALLAAAAPPSLGAAGLQGGRQRPDGLVVMDVFTREAAVEPLQNKNAETVGRATKRAARELTGDDGNFVVTTDLGNEFATLDRELPEAVHRTKRPEDAIAVVDQWSDHFERAAGAYNARPHETVHGAPRTWRSSRTQS